MPRFSNQITENFELFGTKFSEGLLLLKGDKGYISAKSKMSFHQEIGVKQNYQNKATYVSQHQTQFSIIFTVAEYAFTTIPTYPSSQIGFFVCSKDGRLSERWLVPSPTTKRCTLSLIRARTSPPRLNVHFRLESPPRRFSFSEAVPSPCLLLRSSFVSHQLIDCCLLHFSHC